MWKSQIPPHPRRLAVSITSTCGIVGSPARSPCELFVRSARNNRIGRAGCDQAAGKAWTVAVDATVVRAYQHAAGARHAPPADIDPVRLPPIPLSVPARIRGRAE